MSAERPVIAVLATLDTKGDEAEFLREQLARLGADALLVDLGLLGEPAVTPDITREQIAEAAGTTVAELLKQPNREQSQPVFIEGTAKLLQERLERGKVDGFLGLGGLQGTAMCSGILQTMPYGVPKVIVSTVASGDVSAYVDIKDVTLMFSVGDVLGLNPVLRRILSNAAGSVYGMARTQDQDFSARSDKPTIGMTNLGVLTNGSIHAMKRLEEKGYEVIIFHAVGSGGRAMEQMMREGLIGAVFDYAMGEIADQAYGGLRAADDTRLTVAAELGLPQVIVPGGSEHLGLLVDTPHEVPEAYAKHTYVWHNPVVFVPRLTADEFPKVGEIIGQRLQSVKDRCSVFLPLDGTSRYSMPGGELRDVESDQAFFTALKGALPSTVAVHEIQDHAESPAFVDACVDHLIEMIEKG